METADSCTLDESALYAFMGAHSEYLASHRNHVQLLRWLKELNLETTPENLEAAYQGCLRAGLLDEFR